MLEEIKSCREKAISARDKKAASGDDVDLDKYESHAAQAPQNNTIASISSDIKQAALSTGVMLDDQSQRSGTFVQIDNRPMHSAAAQEGIEVMATSEALAKYAWMKDYLWKAVDVDTDKFTAHTELNQADGYFMRALPGVKTTYPVQACLYMSRSRAVQDVHNIIIAEEGSELHIITGCSAAEREPGVHLGISEFFIKRGAKVTFTMIHSWSPDVEVRPRTCAIIEQDGLFMSNYVIMRPVRSLQSNPTAYCVGKNATVRFNSVIVATPGSKIDIGSRAILSAKGAKTEMIARTISTGGEIISRGYIEASELETKGHLECRGLILGEQGIIHAIPEIKGCRAGVDLSHEAAVGKIAEEEVEYLMARGLSRDEATAAIIRGFLKVDIQGLPPMLNAEMQKAVKQSEADLF
ncbi:MAG: SufD family Fe-S cluster assembly protein [Dehalococcoidia bacterium]|nr:SufD family Fe-S cluster assembly protein [Dehalococcoidia bacterium]